MQKILNMHRCERYEFILNIMDMSEYCEYCMILKSWNPEPPEWPFECLRFKYIYDLGFIKESDQNGFGFLQQFHILNKVARHGPGKEYGSGFIWGPNQNGSGFLQQLHILDKEPWQGHAWQWLGKVSQGL